MSRSFKLKSITSRNGRWYIRHGKNEVEIEGGTKADLREWIRNQISESEDLLLAIVLAAHLKRDNGLNAIDSLIGKTLTLDLSGNLSTADGIVRVV